MAPAPVDPRAALLASMARARGVDPAAVDSIASVEGGFNGSIGDNGTSFGPFQLHQGGALPSQFNGNPQAADAWANSNAGMSYAMDAIAKVAKGLHGQQAIQAISSQFERPADVAGEVAKASGRYGQFGGVGGATSAPAQGNLFGAQPMPFGGGVSPAQALAKQLLSQQQQNPAAMTPGVSMVTPQQSGGGTNAILQMALQRRQAGAAQQAFGQTSSPTTSLTGPPAQGVQGDIVKTAMSQIGIPYQWGGKAVLGGHTDCSGLAQAVLGKNGINIPRTTYQQWTAGQAVKPGDLQPGDLVFFHMGSQGPNHVGIYSGGGKFIEDPHTGAAVKVENLNTYPGFVGARRYT